MTTYTIFVRSNEHARTINTPMMGRTNYTTIKVQGKTDLLAKVEELRANGVIVSDIRTPLGTRIWV